VPEEAATTAPLTTATPAAPATAFLDEILEAPPVRTEGNLGLTKIRLGMGMAIVSLPTYFWLTLSKIRVPNAMYTKGRYAP